MTNATLAKHSNEGRSKIGPWDVPELHELVAAFQILGANIEHLLTVGEGDPDEEALVNSVRRAMVELTKGLCGTVVVGAPELAGELARSFFVIWGSTRGEEPTARAPQWEPLNVTVLSTETRKHEGTGHTVDVALLRIAYYDAESRGEVPSLVDALLVRHDRTNDDRRVRHFPAEVNSQHFDRAIECRAQWLGVSDGPLVGKRSA